MNFLQRTPFARLLLALITGIILYRFIAIPYYLAVVVAILALIGIAVPFIIKSGERLYKYRWVLGVAVFMLFSLLGYTSCWNFDKRSMFSSINKEHVFHVEIIAAPIEKAKSYQCKIELLHQLNSVQKTEVFGKAIVYFQKDSLANTLLVGDRVFLHTTFKTPDGVENPNGFDYKEYLKKQGLLATAYVNSDSWIKSSDQPRFSLQRWANISRNQLLNIYRKYNIRGDEFAVLAALTLGYKDDLVSDLRESYSSAGAMHILAISGLHVGIIYYLLVLIFGFLDKRRSTKLVKTVLIILLLWVYAFITGLTPAVVRATFMFSIVSIGIGIGRKSLIYNTVFLSAFMMLLFNPNYLYNIGFQLSYSAVLAIVFFQPKIAKLIYIEQKTVRYFWELAAVSISAQFGTAPFVLYYFHQFPNYFIFTNIIGIPLCTIIISLAIGLLGVSWLSGMATLVAYFLNIILKILNFSIETIYHLPFSTTHIPLNIQQTILIFVFLILIISFYYYKRFWLLCTALMAIITINGIYIVKKHKTLNTSQLVVFADSRIPIVNFIHQGENYVFTNDKVQAKRIASNFWDSNLLASPTYLSNNEWYHDGFVFFKEKRIMILKDELLKNKQTEKPISVDYLIITNKIKPKMSEILECVYPEMVVIDKSISSWYTNHIIATCKTLKIPYYSIAGNGAFILEFDK